MTPPASPAANSPRVWVVNGARAGLFGWLFRYYVFAALVVLLGIAWGGLELYRYFAADLPEIEDVERYEALAPGVTRVHAYDGTLLAELAREHRAYRGIDQIPDRVVHAFLAAEDRRFHEHVGLDFRGLGRALVTNLRRGTVIQGGSTITQQVSKSFLEDQERTLARKIREAILALRIESRLGKRRILEIYLNKIFLGHGAYGVAAAASRYFDKDLEDLTIAEAAMIAGLARAPSRYSPVASMERALQRQSIVLQTMVETGYITAAERDEAAVEAVELARERDAFRWRAPTYAEHVRRTLADQLGEDALLKDGLTIETPAQLEFQRLAETNIDQATRSLDRRHGWRGAEAHLHAEDARAEFDRRLIELYGDNPLADEDRLRLGLVTAVERAVAHVDLGAVEASLPISRAAWAAPYNRNTGINDARLGNLDRILAVGDLIWVQPTGTQDADAVPVVALAQTPQVEAALYTFNHQTGYVDAMGGGRDYDESQFNRSTQACRQPGSVFKAFYYSYALDRGRYKMDTILEGKPWEPDPGEDWNPRNISKTLDGKLLLRTAFIKSLNTPSIRLFQALGKDEVVGWTRRFGVTTELIADRALSLGASCMLIDELTAGFGVFARGGSYRKPVYVRRAIDRRGEVRIDNRHPSDPALDVAGRLDRMAAEALDGPVQVIDERTAYLIGRLMREVVTHGTSTKAGHTGVPVAGKSGTASGRMHRGRRVMDMTTDTWFVGFTSRQVTAAWMGFDDRAERSLGDKDASYTTAIPMWAKFMTEVVEGVEHDRVPMHRPDGIVSKVVDATHGGPPVDGLPQATVHYATGW